MHWNINKTSTNIKEFDRVYSTITVEFSNKNLVIKR